MKGPFRVHSNPALLVQLAQLPAYVVRSNEHASGVGFPRVAAASEKPPALEGGRIMHRTVGVGALVVGIVPQNPKPFGQPSQHAIRKESLLFDRLFPFGFQL